MYVRLNTDLVHRHLAYFALRTFVFVALSSLLAKISALWLLVVYPDSPKAQDEVAGIKGNLSVEVVEMTESEALLEDGGKVLTGATL
jgi:hypothetical protein